MVIFRRHFGLNKIHSSIYPFISGEHYYEPNTRYTEDKKTSKT